MIFEVGEFLRDAAVAAGHELGIFEGRRAGTRRERRLLDVLRAIGALDEVPAKVEVIREGWGRLAEVIREDRPLSAGDAAKMHRHLARAGAEGARIAVATMRAEGRRGRLADLGGGAGAYTAAWLEAEQGATATLVDRADVIAIAKDELARFGERVTFVEGDLREVEIGEHDVALLANVLHLHGEAACAEICGAARRIAKWVVVKDFVVEADRSGPLESLMFALGMAIYTEDGDVYSAAQIRAWGADMVIA